MEKVLAIGGVFFRARDSVAAGRWYQEHLGATLTPTNYEELHRQQKLGRAASASFPENTDYFGDSKQMWMINFRVRDLNAMTAQLRAADISVAVYPEPYPNGGFARLHDPEGNPVEPWEPAGARCSYDSSVSKLMLDRFGARVRALIDRERQPDGIALAKKKGVYRGPKTLVDR